MFICGADVEEIHKQKHSLPLQMMAAIEKKYKEMIAKIKVNDDEKYE